LRLGFAGGGTDVSPYCDTWGGLVLNCTIDRYCYATVEEGKGDCSEFRSADMDLRAFAGDDHSSLPLHVGVYRRLNDMFALGAPTLAVTTVAEAQPGSGLGSSSTMVVAMIDAYREFFGLPLSDYEVARVAFQVERQDCGMAGGRQDQYAAAFGGLNLMEFSPDGQVVINPLRCNAGILMELEASLVLFRTRVTRSSADIIERQADRINQGDQISLQATHDLKAEVNAMKEALLKGDLCALAEVMNRGWDAKRRLAAGISTTAIEQLFDAAGRAGALGGKVSGAGGGGYLMLLCEPLNRPRLTAALCALGTGSVEPVHFVAEGVSAWSVR
jgi:D-glycero-alpha-D-manno-heptose-7-phosphate kinase